MFVETPGQLEDLKKSGVKIKEIQRNKGLGEMSPEAFKYVLGRDEYTKINVEDMQSAKQMLDVCFGKDTNLRKDLLIDAESTGVDHTEEVESAQGKAKAKASSKKEEPKAKATKKMPAKKEAKKVVKKVVKKKK